MPNKPVIMQSGALLFITTTTLFFAYCTYNKLANPNPHPKTKQRKKRPASTATLLSTKKIKRLSSNSLSNVNGDSPLFDPTSEMFKHDILLSATKRSKLWLALYKKEKTTNNISSISSISGSINSNSAPAPPKASSSPGYKSLSSYDKEKDRGELARLGKSLGQEKLGTIPACPTTNIPKPTTSLLRKLFDFDKGPEATTTNSNNINNNHDSTLTTTTTANTDPSQKNKNSLGNTMTQSDVNYVVEHSTQIKVQAGGMSWKKRPFLSLRPEYALKPLVCDERGYREVAFYENLAFSSQVN